MLIIKYNYLNLTATKLLLFLSLIMIEMKLTSSSCPGLFCVDSPLSFSCLTNSPIDASKINFLIYNNNYGQEQQCSIRGDAISDDVNCKILRNSNTNCTNRIFIHGWQGSVNGPFSEELRNAFLKACGNCTNVIMVDWSEYTSNLLNYNLAKDRTCSLGQLIANFIIKYGLKNVHISGISLGAHVAGCAGKHYFNSTGNKVETIVGLDPAKPLIEGCKEEGRLAKGDAKFVQIIHTDILKFGYLCPIGDADFYVNGGQYQPGCLLSFDLMCSHKRSSSYYSSSLLNDKKFMANKCTNDGDGNKNCSWMGGCNLDVNSKGIYSLTTSSNNPYFLQNNEC